MCHYEKVLKICARSRPSAKCRKRASKKQFTKSGCAILVAGKEFSPAEFGFVCSKAEAESLVKRKWTLEHASNAHTWNFDRESCVPALAFAA